MFIDAAINPLLGIANNKKPGLSRVFYYIKLVQEQTRLRGYQPKLHRVQSAGADSDLTWDLPIIIVEPKGSRTNYCDSSMAIIRTHP
jgi:hypothetical protein